MNNQHLDLADFLADGGQIVGGSAALGATLGFLAGKVAQDFGLEADALKWAERGAAWGGAVGLGALIGRAVR